MAEQLILKGTLEGHVSRPCCRQFGQFPRLEATDLELSRRRARLSIHGLQLTICFAEWLGHQLGHVDGEVRTTEQPSVPISGTCAYRGNSPNMLLSASRDKTLIIWNLTRDETSYGYPKRSLHGHSHIVSDCVRLAARLWKEGN